MSPRVLIVDDDVDMCRMLALGLSVCHTETRCSVAAAIEALESREFDVVVTDIRMPGLGGLQLCGRIVESRPDIPVVIMTAFGNLETAVEAIRAGAYDFVVKPFELDTIRAAIRRAAEHRFLLQKVVRLEEALSEASTADGIVHASSVMRTVCDLVLRVARSDTSVLITGESGTGKELVAQALHRHSAREGRPFVAVNCAAVPAPLLESELFGHVRGAFTDAKSARPGLLQQANGSTIFLDEIGELPVELQPKLLRALQERSVRPVGGEVEVPFDARVVTATNSNLEVAVAEGRFREDLYYRVNVIEVEVPPLRARGNDVLLLAQHFVKRYASLAGKNISGILPPAAERLVAYAWPGNVRELQNCMERAVTLSRYSEITVDDLPTKIQQWRPRQIILDTDDLSEFLPLEEIERRYIERVFEAAGHNKSLAAGVLGLNRKTLYRKLASYGLANAGSSTPLAAVGDDTR